MTTPGLSLVSFVSLKGGIPNDSRYKFEGMLVDRSMKYTVCKIED